MVTSLLEYFQEGWERCQDAFMRRPRLFVGGGIAIMVGLWIFAWFCIWAPRHPSHAGFTGADQLLQEMAGMVPPQKPGTSVDQLLADQDDFQKKAFSLSAHDAAQQWLGLYDQTVELATVPPKPPYDAAAKISKARNRMLTILPEPAAWPELEKAFEPRLDKPSRTLALDALLGLFIHTLNNEETKQWQDIARFYDMRNDSLFAGLNKGHGEGSDNPSPWLDLGQRLSEMATDETGLVEYWDELIIARETHPGSGGTLEIPDLVPVLGKQTTSSLLQRALVLRGVEMSVPRGIATQQLARELALDMVDKIQTPPWSLTNSPEGVPLYEALVKKFGQPSGNCIGAVFEKYALIAQGRFDEAAKVHVSHSSESDQARDIALEQLVAQDHGPQLYEFHRQQIIQGKDVWTAFLEIAGRLGKMDDALKTLDAVQGNTQLSDQARNLARIHRYQALLAADRVDEGLVELNTCRDLPTLTKDPNDHYPWFWNIETRCDMTLVALGVCKLMGRNDEFDKNMKLMVSLLQVAAGTKENLTGDEMTALSSTVQLLIETEHARDAEELLRLLILIETGREKDSLDSGREDSILKREIILLTTFYYEGQDFGDALKLFDGFPYWHDADLAGLRWETGQLGDRSHHPLQLIAARSLFLQGRAEEARPLLEEVLHTFRGDDKAYSLLLDMDKNPIPELDLLYSQDQFEKRPLIWKAAVLANSGHFDEAEKVCRTAISIDPSDGAAEKFQRMRAYEILAFILNKKGDKDGAAHAQSVVDAIRLSERADDFYNAWLFTRAAKTYEKALTIFSDSYCIETRLGKRLTELGQTDEATIHLHRAFELMPESFGRMESHCFGCEGVFDGKMAQVEAEKVFTDLEVKEPKKAQIPYLLGVLRMEQGRYAEAAISFRQATELDPDYINAWIRLLALDKIDALPPALRDAAVLAKVRLDPQMNHGWADESRVRDLAALWKALREADKKWVPVWPDRLYPLAASRDLLQKTIRHDLINTPSGNPVGTRNFALKLTGTTSSISDSRATAAEGVSRQTLLEGIREQWQRALTDAAKAAHP